MSIERGISYYIQNLFDSDGLPKPFSRRPRLTVYRNELYDYAECINLAVLLRGRFPALDETLARLMNLSQVAKTGRFFSKPKTTNRLGQHADAPVGPVSDVQKPLLPALQGSTGFQRRIE